MADEYISVPDAEGNAQDIRVPRPSGRAAAADSGPAVLSTEDKAAIDLTNTKLDTVIGHVDGVEGGITSVNSNLTTVIGHVDGVESAIAATNTKLDTLNENTNGLETGLDAANTKLAAIQTASEAIQSASESTDPVAVTQSGTWTVQPGNTANTTAWLVTQSTLQAGAVLHTSLVSGTTSAMTGTTSTSLIAAPGASLRNYITTIIVSNAHATVGTDVVIQDGSGGTTLLTIPAAAVYGGAAITLPIPLRQPTTNTALYCANVTTGASVKVSAIGYTAA